MDVVWKKIWRDVWANKGRTTQVVLSMGVGIFALGMTMGMLYYMESRMTETWVASDPAHIEIGVGAGVDDGLIDAIGKMPGVADAEGAISTGFRWKKSLDAPWEGATFYARTNYLEQKHDLIELIEGEWPGRGTVGMDRGSAKLEGIAVGDVIYLEVNERPRAMIVSGLTYTTKIAPPVFDPNSNFYVTRSEMERLGRGTDYNRIIATLPSYEEETAREVGVAITDRLEDLGIGHSTPEILDPQRHFIQDAVNGIFMVLVVMAVLTLIMSLFLVVNTITAIVTEQVPQIGIMKAVGAKSAQIFKIYISNVIIYIVLALLIAVPLGVLAAYLVSSQVLGLFNMGSPSAQVPLLAVSVQIVMGVTAPIIAALWPVTSGARTTVRDAISGYGLSLKIGLIERGLAYLKNLPPLVVLTIGNTFRKKGRLTLTLIALVAGGAIFMMVMSVQHSMTSFFDEFLETYRFDVIIGFEQQQRIDNIETLVGSLPGIEYAEALEFAGGSALRRIDDPEGLNEESIELIGVSKGGQAYSPVVTAGRFLEPSDDKAIVLNQDLALILGVGVGDDVIIELNDEDTVWRIVGLVSDINADQTASIVWLDVVSREQGHFNRGSTLFIGTENKSEAYVVQLARDLRDWLDAAGKDVGFSLTAAEFKSQNIGGLMIIVYLLAVVAVLIAVVGSIGLSGALAINALERRKEIGVMRAIGASGWSIGLIFIGEGMLIGFISWLIAVPLSYPLGLAFSSLIGGAIEFDFGFAYSITGALLWLGAVLVLSVLASGLPAWRASRTSVREVLAYA